MQSIFRLCSISFLVHTYQVIPLKAQGLLGQEVFDLRIEETHVVSMTFLHCTEHPTLCILFQDVREQRFVRSYTLDMKGMELAQGRSDMKVTPVPADSSFLVPVQAPTGGVMILGDERVIYTNGTTTKVNSTHVPQLELIF